MKRSSQLFQVGTQPFSSWPSLGEIIYEEFPWRKLAILKKNWPLILAAVRKESPLHCQRVTEIDDMHRAAFFKDGAYCCYCAYVLRISRYLGFQWVVPTNTGIFLRGLKLCGESRASALGIKKESLR